MKAEKGWHNEDIMYENLSNRVLPEIPRHTVNIVLLIHSAIDCRHYHCFMICRCFIPLANYADRLQVFVNNCLQRILNIYWLDWIPNKDSWEKHRPEAHDRPTEKKIELVGTYAETKWRLYWQTSITMDTTGLQRERETKGHLEKRSWESNIQVQLVAAQDRQSGMETNGLCSTGSENA